MSILPEHTGSIIRRDFLDVRRSKIAWLPVAIYTVALISLWLLNPVEDFNEALRVIAGVSGILLIPLVALVAAYLAIAGERESGSIKFTLGQPVSRSALVLGKFVSRSLIVIVGLLLAFIFSLAASRLALSGIEFDYTSYVLFAVFTSLYALVYVSIGIGISAASSSRARAIGLAISVYVVLNMIWESAAGPAGILEFSLIQLGRSAGEFETALTFINMLGPTSSYVQGVTLLLPSSSGQPTPGVGGEPWFLQGWFVAVVLLAWVIGPLLLGYYRFRHADLG